MGKTKTIGSVKTYQVLYLSQFHYNKIALEDTFPSEKPDEECIMELDARIEAMARVQYPELFATKPFVQDEFGPAGKTQPRPLYMPKYAEGFIPPPPPDKDTIIEEKPLLQLIQESKTVSELKGWRLLLKVAANKDELQEAYDKKMDALTKDMTNVTP